MCFLKTRERRSRERSKGRTDSRASDDLSAQISEHYIYNSLQSIAGLCEKDPAKAREAVITFGDYLRFDLEGMKEGELIPFGWELEHARTYLELERLAGGREFEVDYRIGLTDFMVPKLLLRPVVENAVNCGSAPEGEKNRIVISTFERSGKTVIEVTNTAEGSEVYEGPVWTEKSSGLRNALTRLRESCGGTLKMVTADGKTTVTIEI